MKFSACTFEAADEKGPSKYAHVIRVEEYKVRGPLIQLHVSTLTNPSVAT
jgi:hypothetical protein